MSADVQVTGKYQHGDTVTWRAGSGRLWGEVQGYAAINPLTGERIVQVKYTGLDIYGPVRESDLHPF